MAALFEFYPGKSHPRVKLLQRRPTVADLHHQQAVVLQVICGAREDTPGEMQAVSAGAQCQFRLVQVFSWHRRQVPGVDIGRVAENNVVALRVQAGKQVPADDCDSLLQAQLRGVFGRKFQGPGIQVHQVDHQARLVVSRGQANTTAPATEIQHALRLLAFRQIHKVLGMDQLPKFQGRRFNTRKRKATEGSETSEGTEGMAVMLLALHVKSILKNRVLS